MNRCANRLKGLVTAWKSHRSTAVSSSQHLRNASPLKLFSQLHPFEIFVFHVLFSLSQRAICRKNHSCGSKACPSPSDPERWGLSSERMSLHISFADENSPLDRHHLTPSSHIVEESWCHGSPVSLECQWDRCTRGVVFRSYISMSILEGPWHWASLKQRLRMHSGPGKLSHTKAIGNRLLCYKML